MSYGFQSAPLLGLDNPTLVSISSNVKFKNYNEPLQAHLSLTGDPTEMM